VELLDKLAPSPISRLSPVVSSSYRLGILAGWAVALYIEFKRLSNSEGLRLSNGKPSSVPSELLGVLI